MGGKQMMRASSTAGLSFYFLHSTCHVETCQEFLGQDGSSVEPPVLQKGTQKIDELLCALCINTVPPLL